MARRDSLGAGSLSPVRALKARGERPAILGAQGSRSPLGGLRSPCNAARRSLVERANPADATLAKSVNVRPGGFSRKQVSFESDRHSRINAFFNEGDGLKDPGAPGGCNPAFHVRQRRRPPTPNGVSVRKHDLYGNNDGWFSPQNRMRALPHLPPSPVRAPHSTPVQGTGVPPSCVNASSSEDASDNEFHPDRQSPLYVHEAKGAGKKNSLQAPATGTKQWLFADVNREQDHSTDKSSSGRHQPRSANAGGHRPERAARQGCEQGVVTADFAKAMGRQTTQALSPAEKRAAEKRERVERDREVLLDMYEAAKNSGHVRQTTLADRA